MPNVIEYDYLLSVIPLIVTQFRKVIEYDCMRSENYDYNYDYLKKYDQLQPITIVIPQPSLWC